MLLIDFSLFLDSLAIFLLAFLIDAIIGEYPNRIHPTVGIGKIIEYLKPKISDTNPRVEKANGILLVITVILLISLPVFFGLFAIRQTFGSIPYIITAAFLFKATFAIKSMKQYTAPITIALEKGDLAEARKWLPFIVRRDPNKLNERQIISATVESIAESTTDGATAPFFYYALFGVPGAFAYRVVNTLDSMVGYKDIKHKNIGWFTAKLDTIANCIPARLTALLMVVSSALLGEHWHESWRILKRDKGKTASLNAGWTIAAMAGALNTQLEKQGHYVLGDDHGSNPDHIFEALQVMKLVAVLFGFVVVLPVIVLFFMLFWLYA